MNSLLLRVDNWAHRGGPRYAEGLHPGYWEITSLYVLPARWRLDASWPCMAYTLNSRRYLPAKMHISPNVLPRKP